MDSQSPAAAGPVRIEARDGVGEIILHRPPSNVLNLETLACLEQTIRKAIQDPSIRVLLLRSEGKHFSAGVDVGDHVGEKAALMLTVFHGAIGALWDSPIPTVALVQGAAMGGGMEVAMAADLTVAAADARLGQPEVLVGVFPPVAAALLPAEIGPKNALDLVLTGRTLSGEEAYRLGVTQRCVPADKLLDEGRALARHLAGLSRPVLVATKRAVRQACGRDFPAALHQAEHVYDHDLMKSHDAHEGLAAFLEKRKPVWRHV